MATESMSAANDIPISADAKLRVTVETGTTQVASGSKQEDQGQTSLKQILASLAETKKYLPNQVYTFLDSMEGKTLDDLRLEAMHLANKAQEEAKKRAGDVSNYGKSMVENANQKVHGVTDMAMGRVQDVTDMAKDRTNDIASGLANKGREMVQPPLQATKEVTKSLAMKGLETGSDLAFQTWQSASQRFLPYITPYATKARTYLPQPAKTFLEQNVDGKSMNELKDMALKNTRQKLLSVTKETPPTSLTELVGEVKDATLSGNLFRNSLTLSEQAASAVFGQTEIPKDASSLRRMYNLSTKVTGGVKDMTNQQIHQATQQALDMWSARMNQARGMAMQRVDHVKGTVVPVIERIGATPVVPGFVYKLLREEEKKGANSGSSETSATATTAPTKQTVPSTTVRIDIVGMKPQEDAPQGTTSTSDNAPSAPPAVPKDATKDAPSSSTQGATTSSSETVKTMDLKDASKQGAEKQPALGDTNAQGMGEAGSAGMGVTTTGGETQQQQSEGADSAGEQGEHKSSKKKKQHNKL